MRLLILIIQALYMSVILACSGSQGQNTDPSGPGSPTAQTQSSTENTPEGAAAQSLATLRKLTNEQTYRDLGFESVSDVQRASLGQPLRIFFVRLDHLRAFRAGDDPRRLLTDVNRYMFPVLVDGIPRSGITVESINGRWEAVGFGGAGITTEYARVRILKTASGSKDFIAVQVPAMRLNFLGHGVGEAGLVLTPLPSNTDADLGARMFRNDRSIIGFKAHTAREGATTLPSDLRISNEYRSQTTDEKAGDIFTKLAPAAKTIRDDVPR